MKYIYWDNRADIDPDVPYHGLKPAWMETSQEFGREDGSKLVDSDKPAVLV